MSPQSQRANMTLACGLLDVLISFASSAATVDARGAANAGQATGSAVGGDAGASGAGAGAGTVGGEGEDGGGGDVVDTSGLHESSSSSSRPSIARLLQCLVFSDHMVDLLLRCICSPHIRGHALVVLVRLLSRLLQQPQLFPPAPGAAIPTLAALKALENALPHQLTEQADAISRREQASHSPFLQELAELLANAVGASHEFRSRRIRLAASGSPMPLHAKDLARCRGVRDEVAASACSDGHACCVLGTTDTVRDLAEALWFLEAATCSRAVPFYRMRLVRGEITAMLMSRGQSCLRWLSCGGDATTAGALVSRCGCAPLPWGAVH